MGSKEQHPPGDDDGGSGSDDEYWPPWLNRIVTGDFAPVVVASYQLDDGGDGDGDGANSRPGYLRCREVVVPDASDVADGKTGAALRQCRLRKYSTVLLASDGGVAPYVGLIDKLWRRADAEPLAPETFRSSDVFLEAYWFYRPAEVPEGVWRGVGRDGPPPLRGAEFRLTRRHRPRAEARSERQLLFSSHHTRHDYAGLKGLLSLDTFLHPCAVHWRGMGAQPPPRLAVRSGRLLAQRLPGFVAVGFLWCGGKRQPQLDAGDKRVFALDGGGWGDRKTERIARHMVEAERRRMAQLERRNRAVLARYEAARAAGRTPDSDDGGAGASDDDGGGGGGEPGAGAAASTGPTGATQQEDPTQQQQQGGNGQAGARAATAAADDNTDGVDDDD